MKGRDPRTDPRTGDVLRRGNDVRTVGVVADDAVEMLRPGQCKMVTVRSYFRWAKDAEVIPPRTKPGDDDADR